MDISTQETYIATRRDPVPDPRPKPYEVLPFGTWIMIGVTLLIILILGWCIKQLWDK